QSRDFMRALIELFARERRSLRLPDELLRVGRLHLRARENREDENWKNLLHRIAFCRFSCRISVDIGPSYFATIVPCLSRKNVSGTPPTPYAIAVLPRSSTSVGYAQPRWRRKSV